MNRLRASIREGREVGTYYLLHTLLRQGLHEATITGNFNYKTLLLSQIYTIKSYGAVLQYAVLY